jgi:phosphohistidine phosphatase
MRLFFLRHGLADHPVWTEPDSQRPLNAAGIEKMKRSAQTLHDLDLGLEAILTSPLVRAHQTAELAGKNLPDVAIRVDDRLSPGFNLEQLSGLLADYPDAGALMLVGHEPDFSEVIGDLTGGMRILVKKGSLARVDLYHLNPPAGNLVWMIPPKLLAR